MNANIVQNIIAVQVRRTKLQLKLLLVHLFWYKEINDSE